MNKKNSVGIFALTMLMVGAVDGISNLPSIALFGPQLIIFFVIACLLFLLPTGLISAELCTQFSDNSGIYIWSKHAFGSSFGAISIWLQWINTMVWFPTCLTTLTGTAAYLISPRLAHNPTYLVTVSLTVFWTMTILNFKGIKNSTKIASFATTAGMIIPMGLIIGLSALWLLIDKPVALTLTQKNILPHFSNTTSWASLTAIITAFLGMELATVHVKKISNAHTVFPKALIYSMVVIVLTMGIGSLGVALIIPQKDIVLVTGTVQAFNVLFAGFHAGWLEKILGAMLLFGSIGAMINWLISPAKGLAQAVEDGYLPKFLAKENNHGASRNILIFQGIIVSMVTSAFFLMPSINGSYWLLLDLSTELYIIMYLLMFVAAFKLLLNCKKIQLIPGKKKGAIIITIFGGVGCLITIVVGFFPPSNINVGSHLHYIVLFTAGIITMTLPSLFLIWHKSKFANQT